MISESFREFQGGFMVYYNLCKDGVISNAYVLHDLLKDQKKS